MKNKTEAPKRAVSTSITTGSASARPVGVTAPPKAKGGNITKARG